MPTQKKYATDRFVGECLHGDLKGEREILLLGDSHAAQLNYFADIVGKALHARIRVITASSCINIPGFDVERLPEWARLPCLDQIAAAQGFLDKADALMVAGKWQFHVGSPIFMRAFDEFLTNAARKHLSVAVLAQVPMLSSNVQRVHRFQRFGISGQAVVALGWQNANRAIKTLTARHANARFLDFSAIPLFATPPFSDGVLIYSDSQHLNESGALAYGREAVSAINAWLDAVRPMSTERANSDPSSLPAP